MATRKEDGHAPVLFHCNAMKKRKNATEYLFISQTIITFAPETSRKGRSPVGLERCSHIAEVIGSSPIVPTWADR